jgi:hypothetical protein
LVDRLQVRRLMPPLGATNFFIPHENATLSLNVLFLGDPSTHNTDGLGAQGYVLFQEL